MVRLLLAGLAGGVAMFVWSSIAHMATPLGEIGVSDIPNDEAMIAAMHQAIGDKEGLYMFPSVGFSAATPAERENAMALYDEKLKTSPSGILVFHPPGEEGLTAQRLIVEFISNVVETTLLTLILAATALLGFAARLGIAAAVGACAVISTNVSYFNWYGFPLNYTLSYMTMDFVGYLVAGAVILLIIGSRKAVA